MSPIPESTNIKHRYLIETGDSNYPCDNYTIYVGQGVLCICVFPEYTDVFMVVGAVTAFHDFLSGMTLEKFEEEQKKDISATKALQKPTNSVHQDVNCQ
jgi:hypothetical protein